MTLVVSKPPPAWTEAPTPSVYEVSSPEFMDHSCEAFEDQDYAVNEEETTTSAWHLLSTIYLPILCIRLRRSFFGMASLIRSILLGHCLRFLVTYLAPTSWDTLSHQPCLQLFFQGSGRTDPRAWPPPTFTLLAFLTVVAFIVHPDGMTWIILGKLRDSILIFLQSSTTCWNIVVDDYGIIPTVTAATTLASLVLLVFVLYRISSPKPKNNAALPQKKKKRKPHKGGRGGRIKGRKQQVEPKRLLTERVEEEEEVVATDIACEREVAHIPCQKAAFLPTQLMTQEPTRPRVLTADTAPMDDQSVESASIRSTSSAPSSACAKTLEEGTKTTRTQNRRQGNANFLPKELTMQEPTRPRVLTADTALTDDQYIESASVESTASATSPAYAKTLEKGKNPTRTPNRRRGNAKRGKKTKSFDASDATPPNKSHRSRQSGNPIAQRPSERPLDASNDEPLFSTPLSSPAPNVSPARVTAVSPTSSLFSYEPIASSNPNTPTASYPSRGLVHGMSNASYNAPNYATYYSRSHVAPGKSELAAFLAQVCLVGTFCSDLLEDLDDVDALSRLSDAQFELYNVTPDNMARIKWMLAARSRAGSSPMYSSAHASPIRPPPGLVAKSDDQLLPSPPRLNQAVGHDARESNFGYRTDVGFGQSLGGTKLQLPSLLQSYNVSNNSLYDEEDQIEAELQELGGQMVGSILDFEG